MRCRRFRVASFVPYPRSPLPPTVAQQTHALPPRHAFTQLADTFPPPFPGVIPFQYLVDHAQPHKSRRGGHEPPPPVPSLPRYLSYRRRLAPAVPFQDPQHPRVRFYYWDTQALVLPPFVVEHLEWVA
eukprot:6426124-Prymnesium_polylepis.1